MYKILLVDDEPLIHISFKSFVVWEEYFCNIVDAAENGQMGLELFKKYQPDIVITDLKMPIMDGLTLIKEILKINPQCVILVLSAYDDFDLVKQAFRLGAIDYIRKMEMTPSSILQAVLTAVEKVKTKVNNPNETISQPYYRYHPVDLWISKNNVNTLPENLVVLRIKIMNYDVLIKSYQNDPDFLMRSISEIILSAFKNSGETDLTSDYTNIITVFFNSKNSFSNKVIHTTHNCFLEAVSNLNRILEAVAIAGVCYAYKEAQRIEEAFDYAECALQTYFYNYDCNFIVYEKVMCEQSFTIDSQKNYKTLSNYLTNIHEKEAEDVFEQIYVKKDKMNFNDIKKVYEMYDGYVAIILNECAALNNPKELLETVAAAQLCRFETLLEWNIWLKNCLTAYKTYFLIDNPLIKRVIDYVHKNYNNPISLVDVAEKHNINQAYLSRLFAQEIGIHFTRYLNEYRVNMAKKLLQEGVYKIYEISEKVGYSNSEYFYRIFKEVTGVSPKKFVKNK